MSRELVSREALGGAKSRSDVVPVRGDQYDVPITIKAYRRGDTFLFRGRISKITVGRISATVAAGVLNVGEVICLQHSNGLMGQMESYARVLHQRGEICEFEFLSLNNQQVQSLTETCDWILLDLA